MDENLCRQVAKSLASKYYAVNDGWLRDCVEYYWCHNKNSTHEEILEFVVAQCQLSNLREISNEKPCLPKDLAGQKSTILHGNFILQMDKVYDISESKYKQLEKIRNLSNDNVEITEAERAQDNWEPKKKRMLYFHLTDGTQNVTGLEHSPIRFFDDDLLPGYKLLIKGPVTCRRGAMMLTETNISGIGGEAAELLIPNAVENILARALNHPENPDPYNDNTEKEGGDDMNDDGEIIEAAVFSDDFDINLEDIMLIERQSQHADTTTETTNDRYIESDHTASSDHRPHPPDFSLDREPIESLPPMIPVISKTESELFFETIDDSMFEQVTENSPQALSTFCENGKNQVAGSSRSSNPVSISEKTVITEQSIKEPSGRRTSAKLTDCETRMQPKQMPPLSFAAPPKSYPSTDLSVSKIDNKCCESTGATTSMVITDENVVAKNSSALLSTVTRKRAAAVSSKKSPFTNRKITDYVTKVGPRANVASDKERVTWVPICDLLTPDIPEMTLYKTIKGKVTEFDKLSRNDQSWELNTTITDATGSIDATFSSQILEATLGFSVSEFSRKKKLIKTDPNLKEQLRQDFRNAEMKFKNLDGLFQLELAHNKKPKIIKLTSA